MLVLSRKLNEALIINNEIEVRIVGIIGDKIRLGITAPRHIPVFRKELLEPDTTPGEATTDQP